MPVELGWPAIAVRLALSLAAGALIGANRGEQGHAAGLRTTTLVCLAASVAMIQANLLLPVAGKTSDSFIVMDLMRLPLGILSGMGFIGAGAILRKEDAVVGVTTAATLWFVTVIGLCFGGGQLGLGVTAMVLALLVLWAMKRVDLAMYREHRAILTIRWQGKAPEQAELLRVLSQRKVQASYLGGCYPKQAAAELVYDVRWREAAAVCEPTGLIQGLLDLPEVASVEWKG